MSSNNEKEILFMGSIPPWTSQSESWLPLHEDFEDDDDLAQLLLTSCTPCSDELDHLLDFLLTENRPVYPSSLAAPAPAPAPAPALPCPQEDEPLELEDPLLQLLAHVPAFFCPKSLEELDVAGTAEELLEEMVMEVSSSSSNGGGGGSEGKGGGGHGRKKRKKESWWSQEEEEEEEEQEDEDDDNEEGASIPANKNEKKMMSGNLAAVSWITAKHEPSKMASPPPSRWPEVHVAKRSGSEPEARYQRKVSSEEEALNDGYRWRKYGQKKIKGHSFPRGYYKCCTNNCDVKKQVEKCDEDGQFLVTYEGIHLHYKPFNLNLNLHKQPNQECKIATALLNLTPICSSSCSTSTIARTFSPIIVNNDTTQLSKLVSL